MADYTDHTSECRYLGVWCTKYRIPVLEQEIKTRVMQVIEESASSIGVHVCSVCIAPAFVQIVFTSDPKIAPHKIIKLLKYDTAHMIREEFPETSAKLKSVWTRTYMLKTLGNLSDQEIRAYIFSQKTRAETERPHTARRAVKGR